MSQTRTPTEHELALLSALIESSTVGRDALRGQLKRLEVEGGFTPHRDIYELKLTPRVGEEATEADGNPVTAVGEDTDHVPVVVQLLVHSGRLSEFAIFRGDGEPIEQLPKAHALRYYDTHEFHEGQVRHLTGLDSVNG